jgi:hypothetical protein
LELKLAVIWPEFCGYKAGAALAAEETESENISWLINMSMNIFGNFEKSRKKLALRG